MNRRFVAPAALLVLALSSCTGTIDDPAPTPTSAAPTSTPSPSPTDPTAVAEAAVLDAVHTYYSVSDELRTDPEVPVSALDEVAGGILRDAELAALEKWRTDGWSLTGSTRLVDERVQSLDVAGGTALVDVCYDVTGTVIHDGAGNDVTPDRPDRGWERLHLTSTDRWRVTDAETLENAPCEGP